MYMAEFFCYTMKKEQKIGIFLRLVHDMSVHARAIVFLVAIS